MKTKFFLLDINEDLREEKACARFWGIDEDGKRILITATQLSPYFYAFSNTSELESLGRRLLEDKKTFPNLDRVSIETKKRLGQECKVLKIGCTKTDAVSKYARAVSRLQPKMLVFESDLRLSVRYVTDWLLKPCSWHECEVEATEGESVKVDDAYVAREAPKVIDNDSVPKLRTLAFSLIAVGEKGAAKPDRDPIRLIAIETNTSETKTLLASETSDKPILSEFIEYVRKFNPDVIVSFGGNRTYWPYLMQRSEENKLKMEIGRDSSAPHPSVYGHISVAGRVNLDLADVHGDLYEVKVKTIANVAKFLQVPSAQETQDVDEMDIHDLWIDEAGRNRLIRNVKANVKVCLELIDSSFNFPMQLSALTGLPLDQVMAAPAGFRVDSYLIKEAHAIGEVIPPRNEQPYFTYRGAIVLEPKTGIHENVAVLDFASMYPSLMVKYNLSPDTLIQPDETILEENVYIIPEVKHRFRKTPDGFYKIVLENLIKQRAMIKMELQEIADRSTRQRILKERDRALKVLTNACYGYAGWAGARWYIREVAESAAALGRDAITKTIDKAEALELKVIYGDTDSIFVTDDEKVDQLIDWVRKELDLEIRRERKYVRVLFTEAMKRYAGLLPDGSLDIVGLEVVRGDWSDLARDVQEQVLIAILKDQSTEKAIEGVKVTIRKLRNREIPLTELIIRKTLTKPIEEYRVRTPHVEVAMRLLKEGWSLSVGDKVAYVITKGSEKLFEKARPPHHVKPEDIDTVYYLDNQVKPAAMRILERFGVSERQIAI